MEREITLSVNGTKKYLSSETKIFKTERFLFATKKISGIDGFVLEMAEEIQTILPELENRCKNFSTSSDENTLHECFKVETIDKQFSFLFVTGFMLQELSEIEISKNDIVFFEDVSNHENLRSNDQRVVSFLRQSKVFSVTVEKIAYEVSFDLFKKLYHLTVSQFTSLPLLSKRQREIVETENKNILVQGVAGSGKTNICISKIMFASGRNYSGKILYTTFSRGLLVDTKNKIELIKNDIKDFIEEYESSKIVFLDKNHKKAIENRLGISFDGDDSSNILPKMKQVVEFLETHVDYLLLGDLYEKVTGKSADIADEKFFTENFLFSMNNHQLKSKFEKLKNISPQIVYKEIYGMIFGTLTQNEIQQKTSLISNTDKFKTDADAMLSFEDYVNRRQNSFSRAECEVIYGLAKEYAKFKKNSGKIDNNEISRILLSGENLPRYSLSILDEVQDFTQINLKLFESISLKILAVGDALQMINPSYFNFSFLKNLMYREDITEVSELENNYRNNKKIAELLGELGEINTKEFGTHNFVTLAKSVDQISESTAVFTNGKDFLNSLKSQKFENFTIIAPDDIQKQFLRKSFPRQEVLTVSEIKGLERDTVLLFNILSTNKQKWQDMQRAQISHKQADENSVYRFYFNLFYVGLSRAKHNVFVYEDEDTHIFKNFFAQGFENLDGKKAYEKFSEIISRIEIDDDEILARVDEFIKLGQFDNARFYSGKFDDAVLGEKMNAKIDAFEQFVFKGKNREAGIKLWKAGLIQDAKIQFEISGDKSLIEFIDKLESKNVQGLDVSVVKYYSDFEDNSDAKELIVDVLKQDLENMKNLHEDTKNKLKKFKEKGNGKQ